ncbi:hypothetical protein RQP46_003891 [Phenoliferia psychrophenolica]
MSGLARSALVATTPSPKSTGTKRKVPILILDSDDSDIEVLPQKKRSKVDSPPATKNSLDATADPSPLEPDETEEDDEKARRQRFATELELARVERRKAAALHKDVESTSETSTGTGRVAAKVGKRAGTSTGRQIRSSSVVHQLDFITGALDIPFLSQPRPGKKLLVLDLDHCILDSGLWRKIRNFDAADFARPFLHEFLTAVSEYYDIVFWSATRWRYIKGRLTELGLIGENRRADYSIILAFTKSQMVTLDRERKGRPHLVKALEVLWRAMPWYGPESTIHVDDLDRNFPLNPGNGLKVRPYKDHEENQDTDHELALVARYMLQLEAKKNVDISEEDHSRFRKLKDGKLPDNVEDPVKTWW